MAYDMAIERTSANIQRRYCQIIIGCSFAYLVHYYPADYHNQNPGKNNETRIGKKLQPGNTEPPVGAKGGIDIDKDQCKNGSKKYKTYNVLLFIKIRWYWFLKIKHYAPFYKCKFS